MAAKIDIPNLDDLIEDYLSGVSMKQLGKQLGVDVGVLSRRFRKRGVHVRSYAEARRIDIPNITELAKSYVDGMSLKRLSEESGIDSGVLKRRLIENGVHIRGRSEAETLKWSKMDRAAIEQQCSAAWDACRGRTHSLEEKILRAKTTMANLSHRGKWENEIQEAIHEASPGAREAGTFAIGPYNIDIVIRHPHRIAVEIVVGEGGANRWGSHSERSEYILDLGWQLVFVDLRRSWGRKPIPDIGAITKYLVALSKFTGRDKAGRCGYAVIGCDGKDKPVSRFKLDEWPLITRPKRAFRTT